MQIQGDATQASVLDCGLLKRPLLGPWSFVLIAHPPEPLKSSVPAGGLLPSMFFLQCQEERQVSDFIILLV